MLTHSVTKKQSVLVFLTLIGAFILVACGGTPMAPTPVEVAAATATSLPPTATPAALPLPEAGGAITTTAEITVTAALSETVPLVVEAPEIGVDVIKVLTEVERVGQEMGLSLVADIDNSFTMEIPAVDENGNKIILRKTVRSIAVRLLPNNGDNTPQDLSVLLENAKSFSEEESARTGKLLSRGFRALVEDGYDPTQIRFFGKADLMGTEVYLTVAVKDADKFAQILNGNGAASMGFMSRVPSSGLFALSGKGFFIDAGGMWDPDDPENSSFRDFFLRDLSMGVSHLVGSDKVKDFKGLQPYIATNAYFTAAQKSPEDFRKTVERINNLVFGGEGGLDAEDYLGGN